MKRKSVRSRLDMFLYLATGIDHSMENVERRCFIVQEQHRLLPARDLCNWVSIRGENVSKRGGGLPEERERGLEKECLSVRMRESLVC